MANKRLTKEELLEALSNYWQSHPINEESERRYAYDQLVEIVEWAYARGIPQQKPTVSREWVEKWEERIEEICSTGEPPYFDEMLKEIGIKVEEK